MTKLWQKSNSQLHPMVTNYIINKNLTIDTVLLAYDIKASIAHVNMLKKVKLLTSKEGRELIKTLEEIWQLQQKGKFKLKQKDEDCHTAIENYLTKKLGKTGKKIHLGRSRNDQVLVAIRLYCKDRLKIIKKEIINLADTILKLAKKYEFIPMPGYTHTQLAMPSSLGQWAASFVESLLDDFDILEAAYKLNDQNPLGSAAGFGTSLPLDREYTTRFLGFARTQINCLYCQNSRGKIEGFVASSLVQVMSSLGKIANDLIWFTSPNFNFFHVNSSLTTGSSIMPQKQNLDIMEVLRANVSVVIANQLQIQTISQNLLSGYNKDIKVTKQPLFNSLEICQQSLKITSLLLKNIKPNKKQLEQAMKTELFATDAANKLTQQGIAFREAYQKIGKNLAKLKAENITENLRSKKHLGAPGNLNLKYYQQKIQKLKS